MQELHNTLMGRRLIEHDIPEIHKQLKRIADLLEKNLKQEEEKAIKVKKQQHGIKVIKNKAGDYTAFYKGDEWHVYRESVGYMYWWYAEPKNNVTGKAFKADSKNDLLEKIKAVYNIPEK